MGVAASLPPRAPPGALLEWVDAGASRAETPGPGEQVVSPVATSQVDLAVHVRCGDILKYNFLREYGFLGLSAYRRALEGRDPKRPVRVVVFLPPSHGTLAREKDVAKDGICTGLGERLQRLLQRELHPAEVVPESQALQHEPSLSHARVTVEFPCILPR